MGFICPQGVNCNMFKPIKVIDVELSQPLNDIENLEGYQMLKGLVRLYGSPLGYIEVPLKDGRCTAATLDRAIFDTHSWPIMRYFLNNRLSTPLQPDGLCIEELAEVTPPVDKASFPLVTVALCTRNGADNLALCLDALSCVDYPNLDILVVDNASDSDATKQLVQNHYSHVRYAYEPRPGLNWARNRAIVEAQGEIIAYTDDDVVVDPNWINALVRVFNENLEVKAVTGLVVPYELETEAQSLFELNGGFGRGFNRRWISVAQIKSQRWPYYGTGQYGTGANMAFRRSLFDEIGCFDTALDVGTVTNGGGDLEMFFRVLKAGYELDYEPEAIVRHRHRRDYTKLREQIYNNGVGLYAYFARSFFHYPSERMAFAKLGLWWFWWWSVRRWLLSFFVRSQIPRDLIWAELIGILIGLDRYQKARRRVAEIIVKYGPQPIADGVDTIFPAKQVKPKEATAVCHVDLSQPLQSLNDVEGYSNTRIFVTCAHHVLGSVDISNHGQPIGVTRLIEAIVGRFGMQLLDLEQDRGKEAVWREAIAFLKQRFTSAVGKTTVIQETLSAGTPISIVVATLDRPNDLRCCLKYLMAQKTSHPVEIVVVDNNPASGLTPPVIAEFPKVVLVNEPRKGLAYARNAGFVASTGDIVVATDDDVVMPPDWLEKLIAPFARPDVMIVTGNVFPLELENAAQYYFEQYGGLGRGFRKIEANRQWFESFQRHAVPTWELGATANAAFRATIFSDPQIGLMDEALGPGMPSGVGEDTYLFYKVLKAGYTLVYEPSAYVWHEHRRTMASLRRQLYNYSKGHIAYHMTTVLRDRDFRGLKQILIHLPLWRLRRTAWHVRDLVKGDLFRGNGHYPVSLTLIEIVGNLLGIWALWQSRRRVRREGRSQPYLPVAQRSYAYQILDNDTTSALSRTPGNVQIDQERLSRTRSGL